MTEEEIVRKLKIDRRIQAEEEALRYADLVVTSTSQEVREQYGLYRNKDLPKYRVIPPGIDVEKFYPFYRDRLPENVQEEKAMYARASLLHELDRFFMQPDKPLVLALCRPDRRKNISGLVKAFGKDKELQAMANLAVFAGIRKDITQMEDNEQNVLTDMLLLMDKYDLYGKMAIPKKHDFEHEVPELYRIAASKRGVFVNPALTEPFGITLLEASAAGVPIVATNDGGPLDIMKNCQSGILVDPTDTGAIAGAVKEIISDPEKWETFSKNGILNVRKHYTWSAHAETYLKELGELMAAEAATDMEKAVPSDAIGRRLACLDYFLITDIDNTLIGEDNSRLEELIDLLKKHRAVLGFGVATGRRVESALEILRAHNVPDPDVIIASVGSEIYYGKKLHPGQGWETHISSKWDRKKISRLLEKFDFLNMQEEAAQRPYKVSYNMKPGKDRLAKIHDRLLKNKCRYTLIYSHGKYLDILPFRASKGKAIRYLSYKWEIPLAHFLVSGDSGNDDEMLRGEPMAVVVGNYSPELDSLKGFRRVFFAQSPCAGGIIEGIEKYRLLEKAGKKEACKV
jgi:sucrose-phosphate synthase